jgi:hypothetical protein
MSMMGFAASPATAVLPTCSTARSGSGASARRNRAASSANSLGQFGS